MTAPKIIGNGIAREIEYGYFEDYHDADDYPESFVYKEDRIFLDTIMAVHNPIHNPNPPAWMKEFDGYASDSYFSGILIKMGSADDPHESECLRVYRYYS